MKVCSSCCKPIFFDNIKIDSILSEREIIVKCDECGCRKTIRLEEGISLSDILKSNGYSEEVNMEPLRTAETRHILIYHNQYNSQVIEIGSSFEEIKKHAMEYKPDFTISEINGDTYFIDPNNKFVMLKIISMYIR